jgi:hypothetical protein
MFPFVQPDLIRRLQEQLATANETAEYEHGQFTRMALEAEKVDVTRVPCGRVTSLWGAETHGGFLLLDRRTRS